MKQVRVTVVSQDGREKSGAYAQEDALSLLRSLSFRLIVSNDIRSFKAEKVDKQEVV